MRSKVTPCCNPDDSLIPEVYASHFSVRHHAREGRVTFGGSVDRKEAVVKPPGTDSRRPPPDAPHPGKPPRGPQAMDPPA